MEALNRYIDGGSKRDSTTDFRGIENSDAKIRSRRHVGGRRPPLQTCG